MFQLSIVDHIRLSFGSAVGVYQGHTAAALRLSQWSWYSKIATLSLLGMRCGEPARDSDSEATASRSRRRFWLQSPLPRWRCTSHLIRTPRIYGHRACAARLWVIL